jgi:putative N6-adenine-specific DNA methylase
MMSETPFEIFLVVAPGLEGPLCEELREKGFADPQIEAGGVTIQGGWPDVWRANLEIRGASRVLARIGSFRVVHLAQLDKRARKIAWAQTLLADVPVKVEASCKSSKIYHAKAAAQRIETAIREELGAPISAEADIRIKARIDNNICTLSVDTSGELLHRRGHKEAVGKAPMRETLAALFLRQCGFEGGETVVDPMCGSGTFVIEAAEIAAGLAPGRARAFAFEQLASFHASSWQRVRDLAPSRLGSARCYGSDRNSGVIQMCRANAVRAGIADATEFQVLSVSELVPPAGEPGLVIVNPPYGARIGDKAKLRGLYRNLGNTLSSRFSGWRVGMVTTDTALAKATGLPFGPPGRPVDHGGLMIRLFQTGPLK